MRQAGAGRAGLPPSRCSCHALGSQARHPRPLLPAPHTAVPVRGGSGLGPPSIAGWGGACGRGRACLQFSAPPRPPNAGPRSGRRALGFYSDVDSRGSGLSLRGPGKPQPAARGSEGSVAWAGRPHRRQPRGGRRVRPGTRPCCWWSRGCSACSRCCGSCCCSPRKPGQPPPPRAPACRGDACASRCTRARR